MPKSCFSKIGSTTCYPELISYCKKIKIPNSLSFIRSIEQWVIDLLANNDSDKTPSSHSNLDAKLQIFIHQNWGHIPNKIEASHLNRPPELSHLKVIINFRRDGFVDPNKINSLLVLAGIIPVESLVCP